MKTFYIYLLGAILTLFPGYAFAYELNDTDANIIGHVTDKDTKEHLAYVTIMLKGTTIGTTTDETGHYFLKNLSEGTFTVEVSSIGYKTERRTVQLTKGKTLELNFEIGEDHVALEGVVVSANRNETTRRMAPTLVNVVSVKTFENTNSTCLAQGLNFQPGVRVENNCQNCGYQQVRINGLDGPYTQILIDSRPIFSALAGVYGLEQIPANMIERVEVMRGGGSALFGSSAIAGTINIITKEPVRNSAQFSHTLTGIGDASVFENNTTMNASLVSDNQKLGLAVFGQNRERAGYDHDGDGFTELPELKSQTVGMRSYIKTSDYSKVTVEYHHLQEHRRGGTRLVHDGAAHHLEVVVHGVRLDDPHHDLGGAGVGEQGEVPEDGREVGPGREGDAPEVDHVAEEDRGGADEQADANAEEHEKEERRDHPDDVPGGHDLEEQHDHDDGDEREPEVHHRGEDLLDREHPAVDLDLLEQRGGADDGRQAAVRGLAHERERDVADDEVEGVVLHVGAAQEVREDEAHDHHHEQRVEDAPDDAEDRAAVPQLEVLGHELLQDEAVLGERAGNVRGPVGRLDGVAHGSSRHADGLLR
mgnify:CR=1 FL=1